VDIAILTACFSVLAMVAVPRHLGLVSQQRAADAKALASGVAGATALANAMWKASRMPPALRLSGGDVAVVNGYPSAATVFRALEPAEAAGFSFDAGRWRHREAGSACGVDYLPPVRSGAPPSIRLLDEGC
jgi:hypothetical protein